MSDGRAGHLPVQAQQRGTETATSALRRQPR